jgi:energy-converting hydrogenase Eha subunit G
MPAAAPAEPVKPVARKVAPAVKVEAPAPKVSLREVVATAAANAARSGQLAEESALVTLENCLGEVYRALPSALETGLVHDEYSAKLEALFEEL